MATKAEIKAYLNDRLPNHPYWRMPHIKNNIISLEQIRLERKQYQSWQIHKKTKFPSELNTMESNSSLQKNTTENQ